MNLIDLRYIDDLKDLDLDMVDISKPAPEFEPNRQFYFMAKARSWVKKKSEELGRPMTFFTQTFGCRSGLKPPSFGQNLPQTGTRSLRKPFFRHALKVLQVLTKFCIFRSDD